MDKQNETMRLAELRRLGAAEVDSQRAINTLQQAGYTDCGGELWKPPLGNTPDFGVEMPEAVGSAEVFSGHNAHGLPEYAYVDAYTADQLRETVASAVAKKDAEIDTLKAENERLRADAARYQFIRVGDPDNAVMTWVNGLDDWTPWASPEDVDAAIDAALKGQP